jgi:hypothetical protein
VVVESYLVRFLGYLITPYFVGYIVDFERNKVVLSLRSFFRAMICGVCVLA